MIPQCFPNTSLGEASVVCMSQWVSIGPTTAEALESYNLHVHCSAAKPTPQSLGEALTASCDKT